MVELGLYPGPTQRLSLKLRHGRTSRGWEAGRLEVAGFRSWA